MNKRANANIGKEDINKQQIASSHMNISEWIHLADGSVIAFIDLSRQVQ